MSNGTGYPAAVDPSIPFIFSAFGSKGSGKTTWNRKWYQTYPYSKLCIDVNGEADPGPDAEKITELARKMPAPRDGRYPNLHYIPDPGSVTYRDDLDRAVGMAMFPSDQPTLVWCGEVGEFTTGNRTGPHLSRLLQQSRHYRVSALFDGPRPVDIDRLVKTQADQVAVFDLPDPDDRNNLAKMIGRPPKEFSDQCEDVFHRGDYWHLLWVSKLNGEKVKELYACPPTPD